VPAQIVTNTVQRKRLEHATAMPCRLKVCDTKCMIFTDEKNFYVNLPVSNLNDFNDHTQV